MTKTMEAVAVHRHHHEKDDSLYYKLLLPVFDEIEEVVAEMLDCSLDSIKVAGAVEDNLCLLAGKSPKIMISI